VGEKKGKKGRLFKKPEGGKKIKKIAGHAKTKKRGGGEMKTTLKSTRQEGILGFIPKTLTSKLFPRKN